MKPTEIDYEYMPHILLVGLICIDEEEKIKYDSFQVFIMERCGWADRTSGYSEKEIEDFKTSFELHVEQKYLDDLKPVRDQAG